MNNSSRKKNSYAVADLSVDDDSLNAYVNESLLQSIVNNGQLTVINNSGGIHVTAKYDFGGVLGDVNIVENGNLYKTVVDQVAPTPEIGQFLKQIREASDNSPDLDDGDKQSIAAQLTAILAELKKGSGADKSRLQKALDVIKAAAGGVKSVVELVAALAPLLLMLP